MYTFRKISEIGRARRLYTAKTDTDDKELLLSTTGEFVLRKGHQEVLLANSQEALDWSLNHKLCSSRHHFLEDWVELIRIPYGSVIPKIRISSDDMEYLDLGDNKVLRAQELIQHPIFNHCIVKHRDREDRVTLTPALRTKVVRMVSQIYETDYYERSLVNFADGSRIQYTGYDSYMEHFNLFDDAQSCSVACFSVYQGTDLPYDFRTRDTDETTWLRMPEHYEVWSDDKITSLASAAVAVCIHYQINNEEIHGIDEHPLALHELGCMELSQD
ncbi:MULTISPECIES: hypothetical protein [unclassified Lentimonas]|uniref:hypothetical protein n=1 Tax=unclassified Lentimonas TaxID=2630993 RepID=UPI0013299AE3|nr:MULTISPECIES: hypothetical protein [unclassified Lentimonas]CAA6679292.1 Unannotated [Lentimonas sp. CC4]CAA6686327.1 Unannotated [Lentimonas sp. CC6]CAA7076103.1 Unannotated [Lentimonas sp. CC4]CAA7170905.1 Unannotated [Lentimonas sp. CC21]CAA7181153.1 Unannotated [Lentimonas sp. CC8]